MRSGESSIEQRPDTRIRVAQRISDGIKECEGDGCQRKSAAVEKECRTSGGQTDMTDHRCLQIERQGEAVCIQSFVQQEASVKDGKDVIKLMSSTDESCSIVLNFLKFVNEMLRTASK